MLEVVRVKVRKHVTWRHAPMAPQTDVEMYRKTCPLFFWLIYGPSQVAALLLGPHRCVAKRWRLWYACVAQRESESSESLEIAQDKWHKLALLAANSLNITGRPARVGYRQNNGKNTWFMFIMLACQYYAPAQSSVPASMGCLLKDNGVDKPWSSAKKYGRVAKHQMAINIPSSLPPTLSFNRLCETCSCIQSCIHLFSHSFAMHIRVLGRAFVCATTLKYEPPHPLTPSFLLTCLLNSHD